MAGTLIVTWDGGGNVPPALGIAAELVARGEAVRVLGHASQRESIERHGFAFDAYEHARPWSVLERRSGLAASLDYAAVFSDRGMARDVALAVERHGIDRALVDGLLMGALHGMPVPHAVLVHSLLGITQRTLRRGPLTPILWSRGLHPRRLYDRADLVIAATPPELDDVRPAPNVRYAGPIISASAATPGDPPTVLVSLSTTFIAGQESALQRILDGLSALPVRVIATTGPAIEPGAVTAPGNAEVHEYLPHAEAMAGASLVVGHGGHATTMLALAHGLPLVILPMASNFDQPTIARAVERAGAGLALPKTAAPHRVRDAAARVLGEPGFAARAAELGAGIRRRSAAAEAADAFLEFTRAR